MELLGLGAPTIVLFVGFGALIGVLFGFFGMGGSFLVTPALLVWGYPAHAAVGSGLAFVFGTSVIGALRHRTYGQIDYRLAALMLLGMTVGVEIGTRIVFRLAERGSAETVIGVAYIGLLAVAGVVTLRDARLGGGRFDQWYLASTVEAIRPPPTVQFSGGHRLSVWLILCIGVGIGVLSGVLGVGGGFLLIPAMVYGLGIPMTVAVGTDVLQIMVSSGYGTFVYAEEGAVVLPVVGTLLAGSAFGARLGADASAFVDEDDVKGPFAILLLVGSLSVAAKELGGLLGLDSFHIISIALVFGTPVFVCIVIVRAAIRSVNRGSKSNQPMR
ncbi:MAG: sulfite exporter TauE/SafE family protein [Halobacteriales archaeon]